MSDSFTLDTGFFGFFYRLLYPLAWLMTYIMEFIHKFLTVIGLPEGPGVAWIFSIVLLVVVVRLCILPLFIKQMRSMRKMQALQPQMQHIQNKYKGKNDPASREAASREMMKLYQENHANPAGSCLPALIQSPIFMTMFYVLSAVPYISRGRRDPIGAFTRPVAREFEQTDFLGLRISDNFSTASDDVLFAVPQCA